jgi:excinuclease ABC subunit A
MKAADMIIDIGPEAGSFGGELVAQGTFDEILKSTPHCQIP